MATPMTPSPTLLKLLQLVSPALPIGAYSYSEGLETLVQQGKITTDEALKSWLIQELRHGAIRLDTAVMLRAYHGITGQNPEALLYWHAWLDAARETEELRSQSLQMGRSLLRLFHDLEPAAALPLFPAGCHFPIAFGSVAATWQIPSSEATIGYLQSWAANLISAGVKLIPLGQTAGQRLLLTLADDITAAYPRICALEDDDLETCGWGLAIASMNHETLYSRLFRS